MRKHTWVFFLLMISTIPFTFAQSGNKQAYGFLDLTTSARVGGLGGNNVSLQSQGIDLCLHNPSLLSEEADNKLALSITPYFADIKYGYAGYARKYKKGSVFMLGLQFIDYGSFDRADERGVKLGEFKPAEYAFNIMWSLPLDKAKRIRLGLNVKPILSYYDSYFSFGLANDVGISYTKAKGNLSFGFVARNIGSQIIPFTAGEYEPLPFDLQLGVSKKLTHAPFMVHLSLQDLTQWDLTAEYPSDKSSIDGYYDQENLNNPTKVSMIADKAFRHCILGLELFPEKSFQLRAAYNHKRRKELGVSGLSSMSGFSFGFSLKLRRFRLDYGYGGFHQVGGANYFTLTMNFNEKKRSKLATPKEAAGS